MPRIEPVPWEYLSDEQKREIEASRSIGAQGKTSRAAQVLAYSSVAFRAMKQHARILFRNGLIEPRLQELLRLRSANLNGCAPCAAARKEASVTEADVACLIEPATEGLSQRERLALAFFDRLANDHRSIGKATFQELAKTFSTGEIVELGYP